MTRRGPTNFPTVWESTPVTTIVIGNGNDTTSTPDILVNEWAVSRRHCQVDIQLAEPHSWRYRLTDLGSLNGTIVKSRSEGAEARPENSRRLTANEPVWLQENDRFWVGATELVCSGGKIVRGAIHLRTESAIFRAIPLQGGLVMGRAPGPDGFALLDMPCASRRHCHLERVGASYRLTDLNSTNGTWYLGRRLPANTGVPLKEGDVFRVEGRSWRVARGGVQEDCLEGNSGGIPLEAQGVSVSGRLHPISFRLRPGMLMAIVGTSGSGKSTLLKALVGAQPLDGGRVLLNGHDLHAERESLIANLGYVPQQDTVHHELSVRAVLNYAAAFRMPADTPPEARRAEVERVLDHLTMIEHADKSISILSGGQLKRVNVGVELLTRPGILLMDEPTSGLDPGLEKEFIEVMRGLAEENNCAFVIVTHSEVIVRQCDEVLVLAGNGHLRYAGPTRPEALSAAFGTSDFAEICRKILRETPVAPAEGTPPDFSQSVAPPLSAMPGSSVWSDGRRQFAIHLQRYWQVLTCGTVRFGKEPLGPGPEKRVRLPAFYLSFLLQALFLPILLAAILPKYALNPMQSGLTALHYFLAQDSAAGLPTAPEIIKRVSYYYQSNVLPTLMPGPISLLLLVVFTTLFGLLATANEITRERAVWERERLAGLQVMPYVLSKGAVWAVFCVLHSSLLLVIVNLKIDIFAISTNPLELIAVLSLNSIAAMLLGMLISAAAETGYQAITIAGATLFLLILLSGIISLPSGSIAGPIFRSASCLVPTYWTLAALRGILNMPGAQVSTAQAEFWLMTQGILYLLATRWVLRSRDPAC